MFSPLRFIFVENSSEPDGLADAFALDRDLLFGFGVGNDEDVAALDACDAIALVAERVDRDGADLAFLDGRCPIVPLGFVRTVSESGVLVIGGCVAACDSTTTR